MSSIIPQVKVASASIVTAVASVSATVKRARTIETGDSKRERPAKVLKSDTKSTHPFFLPNSQAQDEPFKWLQTIGGTCQHGVHLSPNASPKVAAFDLDGTLIKTKSALKFPKDSEDWKWWSDGQMIPKKLKALHDDGYAIVIISNQAVPSNIVKPDKKKQHTDKFLNKLPLIAANLPDVPFRVFAATSKDKYRKPIPGTWLELERLFKSEGVDIDLSQSFYVGDAAGCLLPNGKRRDHGTGDWLLATNVGIKFYTPEEFFLDQAPEPHHLRSNDFHPSSLARDASGSTSSASWIPSDRTKPEIVVFVGYPAAGKSTFYKRHFASSDYQHVNQDTLKTKERCLQAAKKAIAGGVSCVIDNTNRDLATREGYIKLAKSMKVPIRAIYFDVPLSLAWHINLYRGLFLSDSVKSKETPRDRVPHLAFTGFQNAFQMPTVEEGFQEVKTVQWSFEGSEEDEKRFNMYLDIF